MTRSVGVGVGLALALAVTAPGPALGKDPVLLERVRHFGGNDIRFRRTDGKVVFVDPIAPPSDAAVKKSGLLVPDVVLITHPHEDHLDVGLIRKYLAANPYAKLVIPEEAAVAVTSRGIRDVVPVGPGKSYQAAGIRFVTVPAYFTRDDSHPRDSGWVGYVILLDGRRYYVTGDTEFTPEMSSVRADVLFPLVYGCGGSLADALRMTEAVKPRIAVPVHAGETDEVQRAFVARLPKGIVGRYYVNGELR